jgi:hypothetical protein
VHVRRRVTTIDGVVNQSADRCGGLDLEDPVRSQYVRSAADSQERFRDTAELPGKLIAQPVFF